MQRLPSKVNLAGKEACDMVTPEIVKLEHRKSRNEWGSVCRYASPERSVFVLLTDGANHGLDDLPAEKDATTTSRKLGSFRARQEEMPSECALDVELAPGRVLMVSYWTKKSSTTRCRIAELIAANAIVLANR